MKVPEREGDTPADFAQQQEAIRKQVREALDAEVDKATDKILGREGKS